MAERDGHDAFVALSHLLDRTDSGFDWQAESPAIERLRKALVDPARLASGLDLAVLLRQAMTHEHVRRGAMVTPAVLVSHPRFDGFAAWDAVGLRSTVAGEARLVTLQPWTPAWLTNPADGVETFAASEAKDIAIAERINAQQVISIDRGFHRWKAMFAGKASLGRKRFAVRIDGRPGTDERDIDMFGDANTDWNLRTVALMARAGILRLLGTPYPRIEQEGDWLEIEIIDDHHLELGLWQSLIEPVRRVGWLAAKRNLDLMRDYLRNDRCPAAILEDLYGANRVGRTCSRCSKCRADEACRLNSVAVGEPRGPWIDSLDPLVANLFDRDLRLLVSYEPGDLARNASRRLGDTLQRLAQARLAKLITLGPQLFDMDRVLKFAEKTAFFVSDLSSLALSRLTQRRR